MSLIKCNECKHQMSDQARICPKCGYPNPFKISETGKLTSYIGNSENVVIPESVKIICSMRDGWFKKVVIPSNVKEIWGGAFRNCKLLKTVIMTDGLEKLGDGAFWGCENISEIDIPSTIIELGSYYTGLKLLKTIVVPENVKILNTSLLLQDNLHVEKILFNAKKCKVFGCYNEQNPFAAFPVLSLKEFVIGKNVEIIPDLLLNNLSIERLIIPSNVKVIQKLNNYCHIKELIIENNTLDIECSDLLLQSQNIMFLGKISEFDKIKITSNSFKNTITVRCDDGDLLLNL